MRLLIADDHQLLRDTLGSYLGQQKDIEIVTVGDIEQARDMMRSAPGFDLVLLDYAMPGMEALTGLRIILADEGAPPVALISGMAPRDVVEQAFRMGVRGFLHKSMPATSLLNAIRFMLMGERFIPVDFIVGEAAAPDGAPANLAESPAGVALSKRELQVLAALSNGQTNKEIAREIGLSDATVKLHVKTLYRRLGVSNRTQAAIVARNRNLV
jgi:two-component system nitrate/nitrite response regulator NarL